MLEGLRKEMKALAIVNHAEATFYVEACLSHSMHTMLKHVLTHESMLTSVIVPRILHKLCFQSKKCKYNIVSSTFNKKKRVSEPSNGFPIHTSHCDGSDV